MKASLSLSLSLSLSPANVFRPSFTVVSVKTTESSLFASSNTVKVVVGQYLFICVQGVTSGAPEDNSGIGWQRIGHQFQVSNYTIRSTPSSRPDCNSALNSVMSSPDKQRITQYLYLYTTNPCLVYPDLFLFVLWIREVELSDGGEYTLTMRTRKNLPETRRFTVIAGMCESVCVSSVCYSC